MKDAFGTEIKEGNVVMYSSGGKNDHNIKIGVVTGVKELVPEWNSHIVVKSYKQQLRYRHETPEGGMGKTGTPNPLRCVVVPLGAAPIRVQEAFRAEFPEYFQVQA